MIFSKVDDHRKLEVEKTSVQVKYASSLCIHVLFVCTFCRPVLILRANIARPCSTWSMGSRSDGKFGPGGNLC